MAEGPRITKSLENVAQIASNDIARAVETVARGFVSSGGYGSYRMHLASNETIVQTFRSAVGQMTAEAECLGNDYAFRELLDFHISKLIDRTLAERRTHLVSANAAPDDSAALCDSLHHAMKRLKDVAIRNFTIAEAPIENFLPTFGSMSSRGTNRLVHMPMCRQTRLRPGVTKQKQESQRNSYDFLRIVGG